jgi:phage gp36-like protein
MSYILTIAGLETHFGAEEVRQLSDRERLGERDDAVVQQALDRAEAVLESYCRARYILPLTVTGDLEEGLVADLARYFLYGNRATKEVEERYLAAVKTLRDIAAGTVRLAAAALTGTSAAGSPSFAGDTPVMGRDNTEGF